MPIIAKESSEKVILNKEQVETLEFHSKHSSFHESLLTFVIKNGFLTSKQEQYINSCNECDTSLSSEGYW
jgi:hypothetical protein